VAPGVTFTHGRNGPSLMLGGELAGLGTGYEIPSIEARVIWPF
jgi:hypothetical protein